MNSSVLRNISEFNSIGINKQILRLNAICKTKEFKCIDPVNVLVVSMQIADMQA